MSAAADRVPDPTAARAVLWAALLLVPWSGLRAPGGAGGFSPVRTSAGCRLGAPMSASACTCAELDARTRLALGLPVPLQALRGIGDFEVLPGIGPARATAIEAERRRAGAFGSAADLARRVSGIGPATAARIEHQLAGQPGARCGTPSSS